MLTIGSRIEQALASKSLTVKDLSDATGIPYSTLKGIVDGYQKRSTKLPTIARALGVNPTWLETGTGPRTPSDDAIWADVCGYSQSVGLGDGKDATDYAETHKLKFRSDSLARQGLQPSALAVVYGRGDSMLPRIRQGDAILFDTLDRTPKDERIYVIETAGPKGPEYSAKRCRVIDDLVLFEALNPDGDHNWRRPRRMDDPKRPITILGRVRWIGSWET